MSNNKSYRIRTEVGSTKNNVLNVQIDSDYDILEILSLKFETENMYKLHTSKYGCVVGRVLANGGVGVPNAKISIFIEVDEDTIADNILYNIYPYTTTSDKNSDGVRYNLLPDEQVSQCHQAVGTMPNKRLVLDDKNTLEIFDKYYKYTAVTNGSGDYMIMGVPVGNQTLHMDVDLSDIGFLSQKPIDMLYKGHNITQFENASMFKKDTNLTSLVQIISQDTTVYVNPFWGDEDLGETISITRHDIDVNYKFEPTCIFMGSIATETSSNGFSKKCVPTPKMGRMDELTTGSGTIEMIRITPDGKKESFNVNGSELIDGNGVWCYQIPMNLDYVTTDEYGNIVPTDNPEKGIATRTRVRFRVSVSDFESDYSNNHYVKVLIPNNPELKNENDKPDYNFGDETQDESFRDLLWNNVYTVKSFIPRIQKGNYQRTQKFSGIKNVNIHGKNNPLPYNNMRVNITFMFTLQCAIIKTLLWVIKVYNKFISALIGSNSIAKMLDKSDGKKDGVTDFSCLYVGDGLCPDLDGWYFAPGCVRKGDIVNLPAQTINKIRGGDAGGKIDPMSKDASNDEDEAFCVSWDTPNYLIQCIEINLAMENEVIQFDFYNDWINGFLYIPRWFAKVSKKTRMFFGKINTGGKMKACDDEYPDTRRYVQQCAMEYEKNDDNSYTKNVTPMGCRNDNSQVCHRSKGRKYVKIFGGNKGGIVVPKDTTQYKVVDGENKYLRVYYAKPAEYVTDGKGNNTHKTKCNLFATDIVLLGSINPNNIWGIPSEFEGLTSSTFQMPPNLVHSNTDTDGAMYAVDGARTCVGKQSESQSGKNPEKISEYTQTAFNKWVQGSGEENTDNITEYAVTEIVGIDWGIDGPKQLKVPSYITKDKKKEKWRQDIREKGLYYPGGHFLGIACSNPEVNIKSCVNLSRICELGVLMSQRQEEIRKENRDGKDVIKYEYIVPSGLISKHEIGDGNYRTIFATLNHKKLNVSDTSFDNDIKRYEFISVQPNNFNGELRNTLETNEKKVDYYGDGEKTELQISNILYNRTFGDEGKDGGNDAHVVTMEYNSADYYKFRMGLTEDFKDSEAQSRYLKYENDKASLPVYDNSFYFYFGMVDGSTAIDKFLSNYYSSCPNDKLYSTPSITIDSVTDTKICGGDNGSVKIKIENISQPYSYILTRDNEIVGKNMVNIGDTLLIENLSSGEYTIIVSNDKEGISLSENFVINEILTDEAASNFNSGSLDITFNDFLFKPNVTFTKNDETKKYDVNVNASLDTDIEHSIIVNKIDGYKTQYSYVNILKPPYIVGVTIDDGYYYCSEVLVPNNNDKTIEDTIKDKIHEIMDNLGYGEIDTFNVTYSGENKSSKVNIFQLEYNETKGEYSGVICNWGERDYNIKVFYSCEKIEGWPTNNGKVEPYLKYYDFYEGESVESSMDDYGMWIHDEETELNTFDKVLTVQQFAYDYDNDNNSNTEAVKMRREYLIFEKDEFKNLSPIDELKLKRSLIHGYSIHEDRYSSNIKVGVKNGTPPYNETIKGNVEEGRVYDIFLGDWGDTSLSNILLPTESWMTDYGTEFNGIVEIIKDDKYNPKYTKKKEYEYNVSDGDEFSAIYGKTMSNKVYIWNEVNKVYELIEGGSKLEYGVIPQSAAKSK